MDWCNMAKRCNNYWMKKIVQGRRNLGAIQVMVASRRNKIVAFDIKKLHFVLQRSHFIRIIDCHSYLRFKNNPNYQLKYILPCLVEVKPNSNTTFQLYGNPEDQYGYFYKAKHK